jgi:hypothetical protein
MFSTIVGARTVGAGAELLFIFQFLTMFSTIFRARTVGAGAELLYGSGSPTLLIPNIKINTSGLVCGSDLGKMMRFHGAPAPQYSANPFLIVFFGSVT